MPSAEEIDRLKERIVQAVMPQKIILFGSHADGRATDDSDVDLLVVMESDLPPHRRNVSLKRLFPRRNFSLDLFVYTPREFERYRDLPGTLVHEAVRHGKVIHG